MFPNMCGQSKNRSRAALYVMVFKTNQFKKSVGIFQNEETKITIFRSNLGVDLKKILPSLLPYHNLDGWKLAYDIDQV